VESHDATRSNRDLFTGFRIASWSLRLVAQLEIAEAGQLDGFSPLKRIPDFVEKSLDHILRFALVQADLFKKKFSQFRLGQGRQIFLDLRPHFRLKHCAIEICGQNGLEFG
jgi:hypothetical protein